MVVQDRDLCEDVDNQAEELRQKDFPGTKKKLEDAVQKLSDSVKNRMEGPLKRTLNEELEHLKTYLNRPVFD